MTKNTVPESVRGGASVRENWARIRTGARVVFERGAKAIRLLVGPSTRIRVGAAPGEKGDSSPPASSDAREGRYQVHDSGTVPTQSQVPQSEPPPPSSSRPKDRMEYRRLQTPAFFRPAGLRPFLHLTEGPGREARLRMYSDESHACGEHLKLELVFPNGEDRTFVAEIAWIDELPPGAPARFDVGLRVLDIDLETRKLIASVLAAQEE